MRNDEGLNKKLQDPEYRRLFQQEKLILDVTELISETMTDADLSRAELARRLGRDRSFVTQILDGTRNLTLRTWADVMTVLGREATVRSQPLGVPWTECVVWDAPPESVSNMTVEPVAGRNGSGATTLPTTIGQPAIAA